MEIILLISFLIGQAVTLCVGLALIPIVAKKNPKLKKFVMPGAVVLSILQLIIYIMHLNLK